MREYREDNIEAVVDAKIVEWRSIDDPDGSGFSINIPVVKLEFEGKEYKAVIDNIRLVSPLYEKYKDMTSIAVVFNKSHPGRVTALKHETKNMNRDQTNYRIFLILLAIAVIILSFVIGLKS